MEWSSSGRSGLGPGRLVLTARAVRNARDAQRNPDHADTSAGGGQRAGSRKRLERALRLGSLGQAGQQQVSLRPTRQTSSMPGLSLLSSLSQSLHSPHPPPPIGLSLSNPLLSVPLSLSFLLGFLYLHVGPHHAQISFTLLGWPRLDCPVSSSIVAHHEYRQPFLSLAFLF